MVISVPQNLEPNKEPIFLVPILVLSVGFSVSVNYAHPTLIRMYLNPYVLEYIGVELKLIYTLIDLNTCGLR